ncbi:OmpH family outer membrane protein [Emcibacter sp. SYSU 3D8]|uniref:OmpH family outer membrane protein n=1 Tax=Emcibacter sp. SYSU 3D8 TaxID=3133969 RepID=UPI0031FE86A5
MNIMLGRALLLIALASPVPAMADSLPTPKIAVIDLAALSQKSLVTQDLDKKVEAAKADYRLNTRYRYEALQEELRSLRVDSANLAPEERQQRQASLEQRIAQVSEDDKKGVEAIEARGQAAMASLQPKLDAIISRVSAGMSLDMVLEKQAYDGLVADKLATPGANDITGLIGTFLNAEVPTVELPPEGASRP